MEDPVKEPVKNLDDFANQIAPAMSFSSTSETIALEERTSKEDMQYEETQIPENVSPLMAPIYLETEVELRDAGSKKFSLNSSCSRSSPRKLKSNQLSGAMEISNIHQIAHLLFPDLEKPILLQEPVAETNFSYVFRATMHDHSEKKDVILKIMKYWDNSKENWNENKMFMSEAEINKKVSNSAANMARKRIRLLYDFGSFDNAYMLAGINGDSTKSLLYMVKEYVKGIDFWQMMCRNEEKKTYTLKQMAGVVKHAAEGLDIVHSCGFVHGDVKPNNILVEESGKEGNRKIGNALIADFGLACKEGEILCEGRVAGNMMHMSPEVMTGRPASPISDLYSLGTILFNVIEGSEKHPYLGIPVYNTPQEFFNVMLSKHASPYPIRNKEALDTGLAGVALKLIERQPSKRYQRAIEVAEAIDKCRF